MLEVYAVRLNFNDSIEQGVMEELMHRVGPEKKVRLQRFLREEDRLRGLFGDLLVRDMIGRKTGLKNEEITFTTNYYGKPALKDRDDVHFNISHSGEWVVGAVDTEPVGIDIEQVQTIDLDISRNYYSEDEHRDLMSKDDKYDYFFTLWSLKESYIKILGKGLSHPLNAFSIEFMEPGDIILNVEQKPISDVFFKQYHIDDAYKMAVCASHDRIPERVEMVGTGELVERFTTPEEALLN